MKIYLHEVKDHETEYHYDEKDVWARDVVLEADEKLDDPVSKLKPAHLQTSKKDLLRPLSFDCTTRKLENLFEVKGDVDTSLKLICSRCGELYDSKTHFSFTLYFSRNKSETSDADDHDHGFARHAHNWDESDIDTEISYLPNEYIDLSLVLQEQLVLTIPMQPLCEKAKLGTSGCKPFTVDLDRTRLVNEKMATSKPFSILGELYKKKA